jgi:hypothetical protein
MVKLALLASLAAAFVIAEGRLGLSEVVPDTQPSRPPPPAVVGLAAPAAPAAVALTAPAGLEGTQKCCVCGSPCISTGGCIWQVPTSGCACQPFSMYDC